METKPDVARLVQQFVSLNAGLTAILKRTAQQVVAAGRLLLEIQDAVDPKRWTKEFPKLGLGVELRTAQRYMRAAKRAPSEVEIIDMSAAEVFKETGKSQKPETVRSRTTGELEKAKTKEPKAPYSVKISGNSVVIRCETPSVQTLYKAIANPKYSEQLDAALLKTGSLTVKIEGGE